MKFVVRILIRFYQKVISPPLHALGGPNSGCRFSPTCSQYFLEAVETHGFFRGCFLGVRRICRCHPWGGCGHDPVPPRKSRRDSGMTTESKITSPEDKPDQQDDHSSLTLSNHHLDQHSLNHG